MTWCYFDYPSQSRNRETVCGSERRKDSDDVRAKGEPENVSLRDDAMRANRKRNDNVTVDDEENAVFFGDVKIENLVAMPGDACELVTMERRMPPVRGKEGEFGAGRALDFRRKISKLSLKSDRPPIDHRPSTASSIVS